MQTDYHMHSTHSPDGHNSPYDLCRRALALGMDAIAITDHVEWSPNGRTMCPDFPRYFADIVVCREEFGPQGLRVLSGVEFGNPHHHQDDVQAMVDAHHFDVVIASVHWVGDRNIHDARCFDHLDPYDVYADYFSEMGAMTATVDFDMLAHFDRIFATGASRFGPPDIDRLEGDIRPVLRALVDRDRTLEINTRFLCHEPDWNDSLVTVLRWYREAGGTKVELNSDAHRASEIGRHMAVGEELLGEAGLEQSNNASFGVRLPS